MNNQIYLISNINGRPSTFEELRDLTIPYFIHDKIYTKWYKGTIALNAYQIEWEIKPIMARTPNNFGDWQFVNITLSAADQKAFANWYMDNETSLLPMLAEQTAESYKFSISYDFENECFIAALSGTKSSNINKSCTMTARSNEWLEAVALVLYKHLVMCNTGEWVDYAKPANWG